MNRKLAKKKAMSRDCSCVKGKDRDNNYNNVIDEIFDWHEREVERLILSGVVKSLKIKDLMTFEDYKNNLFIKADGVYKPKKTKMSVGYSEKQLKKMYKDKPL
jgi:hypothetical protein